MTIWTLRSGMLPGFVAGYYDFDECHVDLARLASMCRVHFVHATAKNIDTKVPCNRRRICIQGRQKSIECPAKCLIWLHL